MRVRLDHDTIGAVRDPAGVLGRTPPREAGGGEIEATPKKMDGTLLSHKAGAKSAHDALRIDEDLPAGMSGLPNIAGMFSVLCKRYRGFNLRRRWIDDRI